MEFSKFIDRAWQDHAADPRAVAQRLSDGIALVTQESQIGKLANLAHHVYGEHLGEWRAGIGFIEYLARLPMYTPQGDSGQALRRFASSLALSESESSDFGELIGALPPCVMSFVYITTPDYISLLWTHPTGQLMLVGCGIWMTIGILVMKKMINFDF